MMRRSGAPVGAADDRNWRAGCLQQLEQRLNRAGIGCFGERRDARAVGHVDLVAQHVLGKRQDHRARAPRRRDPVGTRHIFGDAPRVVDPRRPFGDRREQGGEVDLLESLPVAVAASDVADEQDHRSRILERDMDSAAGVGRPRPASDEGDAGAAGHFAVGIGHVGDPALLTADGEVDFWRIEKRVEHREKALARHGEDPIAALDFQLVDEDPAAGA